MKTAVLLLLACAAASAQSFTATLNGNDAGALPASYSFPDTPAGSSSKVQVNLVNRGTGGVYVVLPQIAGSQASSFTVTNYSLDKVVAPGGNESFLVNFVPSAAGSFSVDLQIIYTVGTNPCSQASCKVTQTLLHLSGTADATVWSLSYSQGGSYHTLSPDATAPLQFPDTSTSKSSSITFQLTNPTSAAITTPRISINGGVYGPLAFSLNDSNIPATVAPGSSASFTVTFAPGQIGVTDATLVVGPNSYRINGWGVAVSDVDALQIYYVDATGVRTLPQAATPISFGQLVPGTTGGASLKFTVTNSQTSFSAVTLSSLSVTGAAYALSGVPKLPAAIQPNASVTFTVTFSASASGTYTGSLNIGGRVFTLTGLAVVSPVPAMSLVLSESTLTSAQQVTATVQAASPSQQEAIGQLKMQFSPSVTGVSDDPAIVFLATSGRSLSLDLAKGAQTATYEGQSGLMFQTGTTAGTLTFTLTFPNTPPITQSYTIAPEQIHISSGSAVRSDPNLVVTINGYDNTYSAGQMSFTFYDPKGNAMTAKPMAVDASSDFHQYFFTNDQAGGSFALQAKFPVTGDITRIGAVTVTLNNSAGQTGTKLEFR